MSVLGSTLKWKGQYFQSLHWIGVLKTCFFTQQKSCFDFSLRFLFYFVKLKNEKEKKISSRQKLNHVCQCKRSRQQLLKQPVLQVLPVVPVTCRFFKDASGQTSTALSNKQQQLQFCQDCLLHIFVSKKTVFFRCIAHCPHCVLLSLRLTTIIIGLV